MTADHDLSPDCRICGGQWAVAEGAKAFYDHDGSAMIDITCSGCGLQGVKYWTATDEEYQAEFGHSYEEYDCDHHSSY